MATHRVRIYRGSCATVQSGVAPILCPLADIVPAGGDQAGDPAAVAVDVSSTSVDVGLADLLATRHAVAVFDDHERCVACGAIGGDLRREGHGPGSNLFFGLREVGGSGYTGVGWFLAEQGVTTATIFLAEGLGSGPISASTSSAGIVTVSASSAVGTSSVEQRTRTQSWLRPAIETSRGTLGCAVSVPLFVVTLLWWLSNVGLIVSLVLALIGLLEWRSPLEWLVAVVVLGGIRFALSWVLAVVLGDSPS